MGSPSVVDLFCGVGGISKGFQRAGFRILLGIDSNEYVTNIFRKYHPKSKVIIDDIKNVTAKKILDISRERIDVLVGGPPCQGFSIAGKRNSNDERNLLFYEFVRIAKELKPSWVLMENVRGIASAKMPDGTNALQTIYKAFLPEFKIKHYFVNAADFGVPQNRKRIIFIGNSKNIDFEFNLPRRKWKPVKGVLYDKEKIWKRYFYSKKLIEGFLRRERKNRERGLGFGWQFLKIDRPSYTIPARYWKDGANALVRYSKNDIRMLTEKECAKIQGLDSRLFGIGKNCYVAIGNAVPPKIIQPFAERILSYGF